MLHALLVWIVVGLVAGWIASLFLGGKGIIRYIVVGMIGSVVGSYLFAMAGIAFSVGNWWITQILIAAIGAAIVIVIARFVAR